MDKTKIICKLFRDIMIKSDPHCFQDFNICKCENIGTFCRVKFIDSSNHFPRNYEEFKKCANNINGKSRRDSEKSSIYKRRF